MLGGIGIKNIPNTANNSNFHNGISFIIGKIKLLEESKFYPKRSYYCNLYLQYEVFKKTREMHFTPPVQTIYAAKQAIEEYYNEGETQKYLRHFGVYEAICRELEDLGFKNLIKKEWQAGLVVSVIYPDDNNWSFNKIHDYCYKHGFTIYPGKVSVVNTFRLCALGAINVEDIKKFFEVFKKSLEYYNVTIPIKYGS